MPQCSVLGCKRKSCAKERKMGYTFHKFPHKEPELLKEWILHTGRKDLTPSSCSIVCSEHFSEEDFDRTGQITRLRSGAAPTLFRFSTYFQQVTLEPCQHSCLTVVEVQSTDKSTLYQEAPQESKHIENVNMKDTHDYIGIKLLSLDHPYAVEESPKELKRKLVKCIEQSHVL